MPASSRCRALRHGLVEGKSVSKQVEPNQRPCTPRAGVPRGASRATRGGSTTALPPTVAELSVDVCAPQRRRASRRDARPRHVDAADCSSGASSRSVGAPAAASIFAARRVVRAPRTNLRGAPAQPCGGRRARAAEPRTATSYRRSCEPNQERPKLSERLATLRVCLAAQ